MTTTRRHFLGFLAATTALTAIQPVVVAARPAPSSHIWLDSMAHPGGDGSELRPFNSFGAIRFDRMVHTTSLEECNATPGSVFIHLKRGSEFHEQIDLSGHRAHLTAYG